MWVGGRCHALAALCLRRRPSTHFIGGWMGPRASLDRCRIFKSWTLQPIASCYSDRAIPATAIRYVPVIVFLPHLTWLNLAVSLNNQWCNMKRCSNTNCGGFEREGRCDEWWCRRLYLHSSTSFTAHSLAPHVDDWLIDCDWVRDLSVPMHLGLK